MLETKVIKEKQNLKYLNWSKIRNTSGIAGSFLKSYSELGGKKLYYKLSNYDSIKGVVGIECVNEIIVDRLLSILGVEHLHYQLINSEIEVDNKVIETYLCVSEDFKNKNDDKIAFDIYYDVNHEDGESKIDFCINQGFEEYIYKMFVIDFLILNRDRHGANIEVLRNRKSKKITLAPLFDHGLSLLFNCQTEDEIKKYDILEDKRVNSYLGSSSVKENLNLIPKEKLPCLNTIKETDKEKIFKDLDGIISQTMIDKIWDMIIHRWRYYENIFNTRK